MVVLAVHSPSYFRKSRNIRSRDIPMGGGMQAKASKIVILCYSIFYLFSIKLIIVKLFRILKIVCRGQHPLVGGGVWCDTPASNVRTTAHQMV